MITVHEKSGFRIQKAPIVILDDRNKLFYDSGYVNGVTDFNLPPGRYKVVEGSAIKLSKPVDYILPKLPAPERNHSSPDNFRVRFGRNPHKCTIDWNRKTITFDYAMSGLTLPELIFILYHEFGHQKYSTEKYADLYAAREMLKKGYNPSQIGSAPITSLSERQYERKKFVVDHLVRSKRR